jgi:hypothetical protein
MRFAEIATLTLHDVKNRLAQLAGRAEARGDVETLREAMAAAETLTKLLIYYRSDVGSLALDIDAPRAGRSCRRVCRRCFPAWQLPG